MSLRYRYLGVDFSGDRMQWAPGTTNSNVWIAEIEEQGEELCLRDLRRVQELPGDGRPFAKLTARLQRQDFAAAGLDAPFSIPWWCFDDAHCPDHAALLAAVDALSLEGTSDFPSGAQFRKCVARGVDFEFSKPLRLAESYWRGRGVEVRSALWSGARPGAPFASACVKLLSTAGKPWPFASAEEARLVEAFPAAQLRHWKFAHTGYNGPDATHARAEIVHGLVEEHSLRANREYRAILQRSADALDAVICCFAARAVVRGELAAPLPPFDVWKLEGWIAVHR